MKIRVLSGFGTHFVDLNFALFSVYFVSDFSIIIRSIGGKKRSCQCHYIFTACVYTNQSVTTAEVGVMNWAELVSDMPYLP